MAASDPRDDWAARLLADEGPASIRFVLGRLRSDASPLIELDLNVWLLTVDRTTATVHLKHSFDADEGVVALDDLVKAAAKLVAPEHR